MDVRDERLLALAASISDGTPVNWERAESGAATDEERVLVGELRLLAGVAGVCRAGEPAPLEVPCRWGPLQVLERVGVGGFGEVYRAWDDRLRREVALKLLRRKEPGAGEIDSTLLEEGRLLAQVRHPNVVTVHGADLVDGRAGLWMELVRGRTLARLVREQGSMDARDAALVGLDLSRALAAIHGAGLVHGDVKAQNVMREEGGRVLLMDPGVGAAGTPLYMAPELLEGGPPSRRSDIYALGVLLYHLVTKAFPVEGRTPRELREAHRRGGVAVGDARPGLPVAFADVVERALSPDPDRRYESASAMEAALNAALQPQRTRAGGPRPLLLATLIVALVSAGVVWLGPAWLPGPPRPTPAPALTPAQQELVKALDNLAGLLTAMGSYAEAAPLYERAQAVYEKALGPDHVEVADRLRQRAWALRAVGSHAEAKALYARALAIYEKQLGAEHPSVAATLADLAAVYEAMGSAAAARPLAERAHRIRDGRPAVDPFVPPLSAGASLEDQVGRPTAEEGPYTIEVAAEPDAPGDRLFLRLQASRPLFVYVLSEDEGGGSSLLFPLPGQDRTNPVPVGGPHRLPGGRGWSLGGIAPHLVVIASPARLLEFENELRAERVPIGGAPLQKAPLSAATLKRLLESTQATGRLFEAARPAAPRLEIVRGLWIRRIDLR